MISCGLYRTTTELADHPSVAAGLLVYFHNHSDGGTPIVQLPESNTHNRWRFAAAGHPVTDEHYVSSLIALKPEGLYRVREHFHPDESHVVGKDSLVQLGYNRTADLIIFHPHPTADANGIHFVARGTAIPPAIYDRLERLNLEGPVPTQHRH